MDTIELPAPDVDEPRFTYAGQAGHPTVRRLRLWRTGQTSVAVVTEGHEDQGMSITNAAERVVESVRRRFGADTIVVEHYPADTYRRQDSFDVVTPGPGGVARWRPIMVEDLLAMIGRSAHR